MGKSSNRADGKRAKGKNKKKKHLKNMERTLHVVCV